MSSKVNFYGKEFSSRLLIGSALYPSPKIMQDAIKAAGSEIVTVSVRRESAGGIWSEASRPRNCGVGRLGTRANRSRDQLEKAGGPRKRGNSSR